MSILKRGCIVIFIVSTGVARGRGVHERDCLLSFLSFSERSSLIWGWRGSLGFCLRLVVVECFYLVFYVVIYNRVYGNGLSLKMEGRL